MASSAEYYHKDSVGSGTTTLQASTTNSSGERRLLGSTGTLIPKFDASTSETPVIQVSNPLASLTNEELEERGFEYAHAHALTDPDDIRAFRLGAIAARDPQNTDALEGTDATPEELEELRKERTSRWRQPSVMYLIIVLCSTCAAVQGQDETVVNGGQLFYLPQFGIENDTWLIGLVNCAPYMCCALLSCWFTIPLNNWLGRRGTVFVTCMFSICGCIWQAFASCWWHLLIARIALGFGIGPKSATVPIYAAETSPPAIRGALTMQWQMWTAFGVMLGFAADLAFYNVKDIGGIIGLNWRIMMASALLPALIVVCLVGLCPESPRWLMQQGRHNKAYKAMCRLRFTKIQAARDIYYMSVGLEAEEKVARKSKSKALELFTEPRNRRAMLASEICMFMQQFCGINVIAYYSSAIFKEAGFDNVAALTASLGFGIINFVFALPAMYTIDTFGRRGLLLAGFPIMAVCLFFTGFSFYIPEDSTARIASIATGIYLFAMAYSPSEGPVPFTYSAEAYPLDVRTYGMALATATTWFFNFLLSVTWPSLLKGLGPQGAFGYYGAWNIIGFIGALLFVRETKGLTLEELDQVFGVSTKDHAVYGLKQVPYFFKRYVLRQKSLAAPTFMGEKPDKTSADSSQEEKVL